MECFLLGTGGMMPMPHRLLTSLAVRLGGRIYFFDAGEGAQIAIKRAHLGVRGLDVLALTHLHADHCLGVPGILMLRAQMQTPAPLTILGPPGTEGFIRRNAEALDFYLNYELRFTEWSSACSSVAYQDDRVRILWRPVRHTRLCLGYRLEELERPGKFHPDEARALKVPEGPLWRKLQLGEPVTSESGETVEPGQVMGPVRRGRHVAFVVDTRPTKSVDELCAHADLAFIEGMFLPEHAEHAREKGHLTIAEAAAIAREAGARRAVLVHISPRYEASQMERLNESAHEEFENAEMGRELGVYPVDLP